MSGKALVAALLALLKIIDGSNSFPINNVVPIEKCEQFERNYVQCIDWCMKNPNKICPCASQNQFQECLKAKGGQNAVAQNYPNLPVNIPPMDDFELNDLFDEVHNSDETSLEYSDEVEISQDENIKDKTRRRNKKLPIMEDQSNRFNRRLTIGSYKFHLLKI